MPVFDDNNNLVTPARQQPRTGPVTVAYDPTAMTVTLTITVVHARNHLRDDVVSLWIDNDDKLAPDGTTEILYGSLPDLSLSYQVYLQLNYGPEAVNETPMLTPFLSIQPPAVTGPATNFFVGTSQDKDVHILDGGNSVQQLKLTVQQQPTGALQFVVVLSVKDAPITADMLERANDDGKVKDVFDVSVRRGGAFSEIVNL